MYVRLTSTSNPQIHVQLICHRYLYLRFMSFFKFSNQHPILKLMSFFKFSNRLPITSLSIDVRIWKWHRLENTLKSWFEIMTSVDADLRSGHRIEFGCWSESITFKWKKQNLKPGQHIFFSHIKPLNQLQSSILWYSPFDFYKSSEQNS